MYFYVLCFALSCALLFVSLTDFFVRSLIFFHMSVCVNQAAHQLGIKKVKFPPGLQLPPQHLRGLLPVLLLGEQRHNRCEQFA